MYPRELANVSYRRRVRQAVVLLFTILIGILISQSTQADEKGSGTEKKVVVVGK